MQKYTRRLGSEKKKKNSLPILIKVDRAERRWKVFREHGESSGIGLNVPI